MKKKGLIIVTLSILLVVLFLGVGGNILSTLKYKFLYTTIKIEKVTDIEIEYNDGMQENKILNCNDKKIIELLNNSFLNKKLKNYTQKIQTGIVGRYRIIIKDNLSIRFDNYDKDGIVLVYNDGNNFPTKINPEILSKIEYFVDANI